MDKAMESGEPKIAASPKANSTATAPTPAAAAPRFRRTTTTTPSATRLAVARHSVSKLLGNELEIDEGKVTWNSSGENALGTSLRYLEAAAKWAESLANLDRAEFLRNEAQLPFYSEGPNVVFPFRHTVLWADTDPKDLRKVVSEFSSIVSLLSRSNLVSVRNGLDHHRDPTRFPGGDTMLACAARLKEAFETADRLRLIPKLFWLYSIKNGRFSVDEFECRDYAGKESVFFGPSLVRGTLNVGFEEPMLICPGPLLGLPHAEIIFKIAEWNEHSMYWAGYPRKRVVPPEDKRTSGPSEDRQVETAADT